MAGAPPGAVRARLRAAGEAPRPVAGWQRWEEILFLHWSVDPAALRPLVDERLELDLADGRAWVSLTPFTMRDARVRGLPHLPLLTTFHEVNLRTYVRLGGVPGIWFFSLDAASAPAAALARATLGLPYEWADVDRGLEAGRRWYRSRRRGLGGRAAVLEAGWGDGDAMPDPPGALDEFLADRHALYSTLAGALIRVRVRHAPWRLRQVRLDALAQTVTRAAGVEVAERPALARASDGVDVQVLAPELVLARRAAARRTPAAAPR
ncbi:conserved hypothetical protein [Anaeromyxobacter dehalogenans 2CP-1]|uniref:DUF2071 domain-containing protein n=2 Tax=Anaeromyxobacter dehalogenans TaxID=161493 RepID=B8J5Q2_ANAD2|nr:conserved hypothetical protein [Anaeromyxobacter dehalogenans 2CP-1]